MNALLRKPKVKAPVTTGRGSVFPVVGQSKRSIIENSQEVQALRKAEFIRYEDIDDRIKAKIDAAVLYIIPAAKGPISLMDFPTGSTMSETMWVTYPGSINRNAIDRQRAMDDCIPQWVNQWLKSKTTKMREPGILAVHASLSILRDIGQVLGGSQQAFATYRACRSTVYARLNGVIPDIPRQFDPFDL